MSRASPRPYKPPLSCKLAIKTYFNALLDGDIIACEKMKKVSRIVLDELENGSASGRFHFDERYAMKHIEFIERFCRLPSGKLGAPFQLELFQRAILSVIYGFVDDEGIRQYQEVFWVEGRKNGKTATGSSVEIDLTMNDGEGAPEVYNVATARDQALKGFNNCLRMVKTSPQLARHMRKRVNDLYCDLNMGSIRALSANTNHLDGLDISGAIIDEVAAMKNRDLYDLVIQGTSARKQPLVLQITTNGFVRGGIFDAQYEYATKWLDGKAEGEKAERFIAFIFELDDREEWQREECWIKANPGVGTIKSIEALRANVSKAKDDPSFLPTLLVKDFNLIENQSCAWLSWAEVHNDATYDLKELGIKYWILGLDASDTTDLTAACLLGMRPNDPNIYALHMAWISEMALIRAEQEGYRGGKDGVPYDQWIARGLMRADPHAIISKTVALEWLDELREEYGIYAIACGYDPWHMRDVPTVEAFEGYFGKQNFIKVIQGPKTLSMPMREIRALYRENRVVDNANPLAEWCRSNVMVRTDVNANIAPDKKGDNPRNRIDVWAAEIDAFVTMQNLMDVYQSLIGG